MPTRIIKIDARADSAYTHECGAMVTPLFPGSGLVATCPRCWRSA